MEITEMTKVIYTIKIPCMCSTEWKRRWIHFNSVSLNRNQSPWRADKDAKDLTVARDMDNNICMDNTNNSNIWI
jgi:hypothetical protein